MALIEGQRGHVVLERVATANGDEPTLRYADPTLLAEFGVGVDQRLVRLDYTTIPEPVYCERVLAGDDDAAAVGATPRPGPRNPPPFDPNAPIETNIRTGEGPIDPG